MTTATTHILNVVETWSDDFSGTFSVLVRATSAERAEHHACMQFCRENPAPGGYFCHLRTFARHIKRNEYRVTFRWGYDC